jgi:antitoxin MazE
VGAPPALVWWLKQACSIVFVDTEDIGMKATIQKWGNSLALRIPKSFATHSNIEQGSVVDLSLESGRMIVEAKKQEYSLEELLAGVTKKNLHSEVDFGLPVGNEVW